MTDVLPFMKEQLSQQNMHINNTSSNSSPFNKMNFSKTDQQINYSSLIMKKQEMNGKKLWNSYSLRHLDSKLMIDDNNDVTRLKLPKISMKE